MSVTHLKRALCAIAISLPLLLAGGCGDVYSRDDFSKAVITKSGQEVEKQFGKPASVDAKDPKRVVWTYKNETFDLQHENKRDAQSMVIFEQQPDGQLKATGVEFS